MRKAVYLDSTVPSYHFDERASIRFPCEVTRRWWAGESEHYRVFCSPETVAELSHGDYPRRDEILDFARKLMLLAPVPELGEIVRLYLKHKLMPAAARGDALHLAYASYYRIDFLLTWNCNHLANANKRQHIRVINGRLGLFVPEIITPLELFRERTIHDE